MTAYLKSFYKNMEIAKFSLYHFKGFFYHVLYYFPDELPYYFDM